MSEAAESSEKKTISVRSGYAHLAAWLAAQQRYNIRYIYIYIWCNNVRIYMSRIWTSSQVPMTWLEIVVRTLPAAMCLNSSPPGQKWPPFSRWYFQRHFRDEMFRTLIKILTIVHDDVIIWRRFPHFSSFWERYQWASNALSYDLLLVVARKIKQNKTKQKTKNLRSSAVGGDLKRNDTYVTSISWIIATSQISQHFPQALINICQRT